MSKNSKYLILQVMLIGVIFTYVCGMSIGIIFFFDELSSDQNGGNEVSILLIIESHRPNYTFNYSYSSIVSINQSLIDHLNNTIGPENWEGVYYPVGGWYIKRVFNATEEEGWFWQIYYRKAGDTKWQYMPVGVSAFKLNQNYEIKFVYDKTQ